MSDLRAVCADIAARNPEYFNASGLVQLGRDLDVHEIVVARRDERVVGFMTLHRKSDAVSEISWLAVDPDVQGAGVGSELVGKAVEGCRADGVRLLEVKTLAPLDDPTNYDGTRRFYERHGFALVEVVDPFPGWEPGNPCAIYVKAVG